MSAVPARSFEPNNYELALEKAFAAMGQPTREAQRLWMDMALIHATLAQAEAMQDLARSNRELAQSNEIMVDELRRRRGVPDAA